MIKADGSIATIKMIVSVPEFSKSTIFGVMVDNTEQTRITELELQTQEMLLKMKHKSQFVAEIIHEIRTPLNGVIGMTSLALEDSFEMNEQQRSYIESSLNCAESLLSIVNNVSKNLSILEICIGDAMVYKESTYRKSLTLCNPLNLHTNLSRLVIFIQ
jgi:signal transduction histidine kinase